MHSSAAAGTDLRRLQSMEHSLIAWRGRARAGGAGGGHRDHAQERALPGAEGPHAAGRLRRRRARGHDPPRRAQRARRRRARPHEDRPIRALLQQRQLHRCGAP